MSSPLICPHPILSSFHASFMCSPLHYLTHSSSPCPIIIHQASCTSTPLSIFPRSTTLSFFFSLALSSSRPPAPLVPSIPPWKEEKQLTLLSRSFRLGDATLSRDNSLKSEARSILLMLILATLAAWQCAGLSVSSQWRHLDWNFAQTFMVCAWWKVITLERPYYSYPVPTLCQNLSSSSCWLSRQKKWSLTVHVWAPTTCVCVCVCVHMIQVLICAGVGFFSQCLHAKLSQGMWTWICMHCL